MLRPIGILGGAFDPVHCGHLRLALEVRRQLGLQEVRLIPTFIPPHREAPVAAAAQRLAMLRLAADPSAGLIADDRELARAGTSYTVDTLRGLRLDFPDHPLCLIVGMDAFLKLDAWRDWHVLPELAHIIIVERGGAPPGFMPAPLRELLEHRQTHDRAELTARNAGAILKIQAPRLEISSTYIRELVHAGGSIRCLTPDPVIAYIGQEKLYR
jgi:nicotinate-nucleotide adenylyltransferase